MYLESIDLQKYISFASKYFRDGGKDIEPETIRQIYRRFDGITWYIQKMLNTFYNLTPAGGCCTAEMISEALSGILDSYKYTFQEILFRLPERQKELLIAIAKEGGSTQGHIRRFRQTLQSPVLQFRTVRFTRITGKRFHHAGTGYISDLRPVFRYLAPE